MSKFLGKVALVTGGTKGIGLATSRLLADQGAHVIVCARNQISLPQKLDFVKCDVTKTEDVKRMFETIESRYGKLDFAFNNAGNISTGDHFLETSTDAYDSMFDVCVKGTIQCMQEEIKLMLKNSIPEESESKGVMVNNIEIVGLEAGAAALYTSAKHALVGVTKTISREFAPQGIRINAVCPGFIDSGVTNTYFNSAETKQFFTDLSDFIPKKRVGKPEDVAKIVSFLLSTDSEYMHGSMVVCDGGFTSKSSALAFWEESKSKLLNAEKDPGLVEKMLFN